MYIGNQDENRAYSTYFNWIFNSSFPHSAIISIRNKFKTKAILIYVENENEKEKEKKKSNREMQKYAFQKKN